MGAQTITGSGRLWQELGEWLAMQRRMQTAGGMAREERRAELMDGAPADLAQTYDAPGAFGLWEHEDEGG